MGYDETSANPGSISTGICIVQILFRQPYCGGIMHLSSLSFRGNSLIADRPGPLALTIFPWPLSKMVCEPWVSEATAIHFVNIGWNFFRD